MKYKLGDICEIVSGSTPKTGIPEYWDGDKKWITPAEINEESYIITDSARKLTELGVKKTGLSPFPEGTVILSSRAPIGKVAIAGCEMYCNQGFKNLICSEKINNRYLYWFLKGNTEFLNSLGEGQLLKKFQSRSYQILKLTCRPSRNRSRQQFNLKRQTQLFVLENSSSKSWTSLSKPDLSRCLACQEQTFLDGAWCRSEVPVTSILKRSTIHDLLVAPRFPLCPCLP